MSSGSSQIQPFVIFVNFSVDTEHECRCVCKHGRYAFDLKQCTGKLSHEMSWCLIAIAYALLLLQSCAESTFCPVTSPLGDYVYITDSPNKVSFGVTKSECASRCAFYTVVYAETSPCRCFNYDVTMSNCSLFAFEPSNFSSDRNGTVVAYQFSDRSLTGLFSTVGSSKCSLMYEYRDQIYSDCRHFQPTCLGQYQFGCVLPSGKPAYCMHEKTDEEANKALKKVAYQQNTYDTMDATLANDGLLQTVSCTLVNWDPWWAVDLGQPHQIAVVEVVNDENPAMAYRLTNFYVKLSNIQPVVGQALTDYTVCAQYHGSVAVSATAAVVCRQRLPPFRYVIVQGSWSSSEALCLTEVRVNGSSVPPHPIVSSKSCSYPYTFRGVLYYNCMQNVNPVTTTSYQFACLTTNRTLSTCYSPAEYVAQVTSYTVNLPGLSDRVTLSVSGWIVFMSRQVGLNDGSWNLAWSSYENGFGSSASYLWLGLARIHQLTRNGNWRLRLEYQSSVDSSWYSAEYWTFTVGDSSTFYTIHFDGYSGDDNNPLHEIIIPSQNTDGMKFSTAETDNDSTNANNCAATNGCGWWFSSCGRIFLNAQNPRVYTSGSAYFMIKEAHVMMKSR